MARLARSRVSGAFLVSSAQASRLVRIPDNAEEPAQVSVKNGDAAAILYFKWVPIAQGNPIISTTDAGVRLEPYESYTWDHPPGASDLMCLSTVNNSRAHVEATWADNDEAQVL